MRLRALLALSAATASVFALVGCTILDGGEPDAAAPPTVKVEAIPAPDALLPKGPFVDAGDVILPATGTIPWIAGGSTSDPGGVGRPTVWTSPDGRTWSRNIIDTDFDQSFSGILSGTEELTALGGTAWKDGVFRSVLWTSTDRTRWVRADIPKQVASRYRIDLIEATSSDILAVAHDAAGRNVGIRLTGDDVTTFELPELPNPIALESNGNTLVLIGGPGPGGGETETVALRSTDAGATWSAPSVISDTTAFISGVTWAGAGFVATGGARAGAAPIPAAWFSLDGGVWARETMPEIADFGEEAFAEGADAYFGNPLSHDGSVAAVILDESSAVSPIALRTADGEWQIAGESGVNQSSGSDGSAIPLDESTIIGLIDGNGYARFGTLTSEWADTTLLANREHVFHVSGVTRGNDRTLLTMRGTNFTVNADLSWQNRTVYRLAQVSDIGAEEIPWEPARVAELSSVQIAADDTGAEIAIGTYFTPDQSEILAEGFFRSSPASEWMPMAGFDDSGATNFLSVAKTGDAWTAVGRYQDSASVGTPGHAAIWSSNDGVDWQRARGDLGDGDLESSAVDVCLLPAGEPIAVGWVEVKPNQFRVAAWTPRDGTWVRSDLGGFGDSGGFANSCASSDQGVVVNATIGGRTTLHRSADGATWTEVLAGARGVRIGEPVAVQGGFAASGSWSTDEFDGPVVWLSADGNEWHPVAIPSRRPGETTSVAPLGDHLLVTMSGRIGAPLSLVRDIERVIANQTP